MSYRSERFNNSMHSLERKIFDRDHSKISFLSDRGHGAELVYQALDMSSEEFEAEEEAYWRERDQKIKNAIVALIAAGQGHTAPTLLKIIENGNNREETIWQMATNAL